MEGHAKGLREAGEARVDGREADGRLDSQMEGDIGSRALR